ncbi:MAG TPA: ACP phosphodiesterase [Puia sp.]|jgi:acyl carrier protein phosphodiesterase|nr:ACP phosphodiesterase [Puia sp.]
MNYLAHAYLSFNEPGIITGNMISDFVKGKKKFNYSDIIQKGIILHRAIDEFTDAHTVTKEAKLFFKPDYRLYSGAFVDVVYDHFLATDENEFTEQTLKNFSLHTYQLLESDKKFLPENFAHIFYYMQKDNWLFNYRFKQSIYKSFGGLVRRASYMYEHQTAYNIFEKNYDELKNCYQNFFPTLKSFAFEKLHQLLLQ